MSLAKRPPDALFTLAVDPWTKPFWDAAADHRLVAPRCGACGLFRMPPTPFCPRCRSQDIDWTALSGEGTLYAYTIVERAIVPEMEEHLPYVPAVVELDGAPGVRLVSNVVDVDPGELAVGMPLAVVFDRCGEDAVVPRFRPRRPR